MSEIVSEFYSADEKLTCRLYLDDEREYYLASVDLLGTEIASYQVDFGGDRLSDQAIAHHIAKAYLHGAIQMYREITIILNGLDIDWGDDLK